MTKPLTIALLGAFQVSTNDRPLTDFGADSARALLVYLAMHAETQFERPFLSALLWPEQPEAEALHALRQALNRLRKTIGDQNADPPFLRITRTTIQFNPHSDYHLDVSTFRALLDAAHRHPHRRLHVCRACHQRLTQAAELYRGDLLAGFSFGSYVFEEWLLMEREQLHRQAIDTFYQLAAYHERQGDFERAQHYARRQVALEPWREEAHQQLMRALARSGQRSAALMQYNACRHILEAELGLAPTPATETLRAQIEAETLAAPPQPPHNLPAHLVPFIGRQVELARITEKLNRPDCRLLTLVGPGGVGKTRLALQVAWEERGTFRDGVYFIPLTDVGSPEALTAAIAQAVGLNFRPGGVPQDQLSDYLRKKEVLLLLDNLEHLSSGGELLVALLRRAANMRILLTSQTRLNLPGEWLFDVESLDYPGPDVPDTGADYGAMHFFITCARRQQPAFARTPDDLPHIARICQLVGGIPLALELAASWLRAYTCQEIAEEVQRDLDFLQATSPGAPPRHHSVRAAFRHAWTLLTDEEQRVLQHLSVFRGDFGREAALHVTAASPQTLAALVDKSMLNRVTYAQPHPATRYTLHNLVRRYAAELLEADPEEAARAHAQHCDYYCALLQTLETDLIGSAQRPALDTLSDEIENVRAAWEWAVAQGRVAAIEQAMVSLTHLYTLRSWFQEGAATFGQAIHRLSQTLPAPEHPHTLIQRLTARRGTFLIHLGRYEEATTLLEDSLSALETLGDAEEMAGCLNNLSFISGRQGDYAQAEALLHRALTLAQTTTSRHLEADTLSRLGAVYFYLVDYAASSDCYTQALHIRRELGDRFGESLTLGNLGIAAYEQNNFAAARAYFEQSLDILRDELGNPEREGWVLNNLGMLALDCGAYTDAQAHYARALDISRQIGDLWGESNTLGNLGLVYWSLGDFAAADNCYTEGVNIKREIGDRRGESLIRAFQSLLYHDLGDAAGALEHGQYAHALAQELDTSQVLAYALTAMAHARVALGQLDAASAAYHQALAIRREIGQHGLAMEAIAGLARVALLQDNLIQAQAYVDEILAYLERESLDGALEPFLVDLTCYRVLHAQHNPRAGPILETAYQRLQARAARIGNPALRRTFLHKVKSHAQLAQLWAAQSRPTAKDS